MNRIVKSLIAGVCLLSFVGCAQIVMSPALGVLYTDVSGPLTATSAERGSKTGVATAESILGLVALGDASIQAASRNGGITKIKTVDFDSKNILGIYGTFTTRVTGE